MKLQRLYLFRHGETNENRAGVRYGNASEGYLTEKGIEQAHILADFMDDQPLDVIYSSPYERSLHTAKIVAERKPDVGIITDDRLREGVYFWWRTDTIASKDAARETYKRVQDVFRTIQKSGFQNVAISSHGGITRAILRACGHKVGTVKNCECFCLIFENNKWQLIQKKRATCTKKQDK